MIQRKLPRRMIGSSQLGEFDLNRRPPIRQQQLEVGSGQRVGECQADVAAELSWMMLGEVLAQKLLEFGFALGGQVIDAARRAIALPARPSA